MTGPERPRLLFLAQMGAPGRYDPALFADEPGGDNEILWFRLTLERAGVLDALDYAGRRICYGEALPDLDGPDRPDAVVIGGSFHSVHDNLPWQRAAIDWLRAARAMGTDGPPVLGICGGHQLMARALDAGVAKVPTGTVARTAPVTLTEAGHGHFLFEGLNAPPAFHFGNEEHVPIPPPGTTVLASLPEMPVVALDCGGGWCSVQFHPEAQADAFARGWRYSHPEFMGNYHHVPQTEFLIRNFLTGTGVLA